MRALLTQRWRLLTVLCIIAAGLAAGVVLRARPAAPVRADLRKLPLFAIIYSRVSEPSSAREIVWQRGVEAKTARALYRSQASPLPHAIPSDFGYLPSPTGAWVFVWETVRPDQRRAGHTEWRLGREYEHPADHTEWRLVRVADAKPYLLGRAKGASGVFPHWYGGSDAWLDLTKGDQKWSVDLREGTPKPPKPLPAGAEYKRDIEVSYESPQAAAWQEAFVRDNFGADRLAAQKLLAKDEQELGLYGHLQLSSYDFDTLDDLLLRPMGIADVSGFDGQKRNWPELSVSPAKSQVARSMVMLIGNVSPRLEARLDTYEVGTGTRLWGRRLPWKVTPAPSNRDGPFFVYFAPPYKGEPFFRHLRWSPDGRLLSFTQSAADDRNDLVTVVDAANGAEVTRLTHATNAFVVPVVGEKQGQPVIPCACTQKEHKP